MTFDAIVSCATGGLWMAMFAVYAIRVASYGKFKSERVSKIGGTALLGQNIMEATYWAIEPLVRGLAALGITPNALTLGALVLGFASGAAIVFGWYGVACLLATLSTIGDVLDGQVARLTNTGSDRGELLDAAVDRYTEFAFLAGLALRMHDSLWQLGLALAALLASFMVSYASAKAEAMKVEAPRGLMRRHERAFWLTFGCGMVPLFGPIAAAHGWPYPTPVLIGVALVAVIGNVSAVQRFVRIGRALR